MDGNVVGPVVRLPRLAGHRADAATVDRITEACARLGLEALTLYSFSSENWKRPTDEIDGLMHLCEQHLIEQRSRMIANNIRFRRVGRREGLPASVLDASDATEAATAGGTGMTLCLALNYGSRAEIVDASRSLARAAAAGEIDPDAIDETVLSGGSTPRTPRPGSPASDGGRVAALELPALAGQLRRDRDHRRRVAGFPARGPPRGVQDVLGPRQAIRRGRGGGRCPKLNRDPGLADPRSPTPRNHFRVHVSRPGATVRGGHGLHWTLLGVHENRGRTRHDRRQGWPSRRRDSTPLFAA